MVWGLIRKQRLNTTTPAIFRQRPPSVPDTRPLSLSDLAVANRRHDDMLAHSPWFRLWQYYGVCCRPEQSANSPRAERFGLPLTCGNNCGSGWVIVRRFAQRRSPRATVAQRVCTRFVTADEAECLDSSFERELAMTVKNPQHDVQESFVAHSSNSTISTHYKRRPRLLGEGH
jgi:hypothetical protein